MKGWLIYDHEGAGRNPDYIDYHHTLGKKYGIEFDLVFAEELVTGDSREAGTGSDTEIIHRIRRREEHFSSPGFVIVRTICPKLNRALEQAGLPTYNSYRVSSVANHKGRCVELIRAETDVPTIPTTTFSPTELADGLKAYPGYVLKTASGHGGTEVIRIPESGLSLEEVGIWSEKGEELILQPFVEGPGDDVRIFVVGDRIVGAVKRTAPPGDFRSNFSLGGSVVRFEPDTKMEGYVRQILRLFDFGMAGIDFLCDDQGGFIFNEIEDVVGARMLYRACPETDILDEYMRFLLDKHG